jgi:ABC-type antimicrobial peptide transport system permease subunit
VTIHVWTTVAPGAFLTPLRQVVRDLDSALPVYDVRTMEDHLRSSAFATMPLRVGAMMAAIQGLVGLIVALMGIYAVVSYSVRQREQEIGIRIALGGTRRDVLQVATGEGGRLGVIGLALGFLMALGVSRVVSRVLYGLSPSTAPLVMIVVLMVGATVWLACYLPARRAVSVDPIKVLRCQ